MALTQESPNLAAAAEFWALAEYQPEKNSAQPNCRRHISCQKIIRFCGYISVRI